VQCVIRVASRPWPREWGEVANQSGEYSILGWAPQKLWIEGDSTGIPQRSNLGPFFMWRGGSLDPGIIVLGWDNGGRQLHGCQEYAKTKFAQPRPANRGSRTILYIFSRSTWNFPPRFAPLYSTLWRQMALTFLRSL